MLRKFLPLLVILPITGCALPPALMVASYAADGVLLLTSGKTSTDHLLSMVEKRDCAVWRVAKNESICQDFVEGRDPYDDWRDPGEVQVVHVDDSAMPVDLVQHAEMRERAHTEALIARQQKAQRILLAQAGAGEPVTSARDVVGPSNRPATSVSSAPLAPVASEMPQASNAPAAPVPAANAPPTEPVAAAAVAPAPAAAEPAKAGKVVSAPTPRTSGIYVVLGSYTQEANARRVLDKHQALKPTLRTTTVKGRHFTRVVAGPYAPSEANAVKRQLKADEGVDAFTAQSCGVKASPACIGDHDG